jgi:hypothetical protein
MTEDMPAMINVFVRRRGVTREILADLVKHTIHADATATALDRRRSSSRRRRVDLGSPPPVSFVASHSTTTSTLNDAAPGGAYLTEAASPEHSGIFRQHPRPRSSGDLLVPD